MAISSSEIALEIILKMLDKLSDDKEKTPEEFKDETTGLISPKKVAQSYLTIYNTLTFHE